ncbi:MAG TPA: hypothetical protein VKH44_12435 [Pirellulaceae bacterium]|nr:hypothetical protein [Pirellulaceae bacterium]
MGSFASSLHVKSSDADRVASTLAEILTAGGWRTTQKMPDQDVQRGISSTLRGLQISAPREGWVSLLDTDLMGANSLVPPLAEALGTHAIFFFVNDSDSWSYLLADPAGAVSEFDAAESADEEDEGDLVEAGPAIAQLQALMQDGSIQEKIQQIHSQMSAAAPPAIRDAEMRIKSGQGTAADMQQYQAWAAQEMPKYMADVKSLLGGLFNPPRVAARKKPKRKPTKAERAAQQRRLNPLRPLLAAGVSDDAVEAVLRKQVTFAEEALAEFLPLLGIADFYANLSYRYLDEARPDELTAHNIRFSHHLRFETNKPPQHALS